MFTHKRKRGRPRLSSPQVDRGTPELRRKRNQLLQAHHKASCAAAESLLGFFYAKGVVSKPLYETGCFFGELGYKYAACLEIPIRSRTSALIFHQKGKAHLSDSYIEKRTKAWLSALQALKQAGNESYNAVMKIAFYEKDLNLYDVPSSLLQAGPLLRQGLETLDTYFKEGTKGKQGRPLGRALNPLKATNSQRLLRAPPLVHLS